MPHAHDIPTFNLATLAQADSPRGLLEGFTLRELSKGQLLSTPGNARNEVFVVRRGARLSSDRQQRSYAMTTPCNCKQEKTDRYTSFEGIDCDGNAARLMDMLDRQLALPGRHNAFWDYFNAKRAGKAGPKMDDLYLIHGNINQLREFFETWQDEEGMALLQQLEEECC